MDININVPNTLKRIVAIGYDIDPQNTTRQSLLPAFLMSNPDFQRVADSRSAVYHVPTGTTWGLTVTGKGGIARCRQYRNGTYHGIITFSMRDNAAYLIESDDVYLQGTAPVKVAGRRKYYDARAALASGRKYG